MASGRGKGRARGGGNNYYNYNGSRRLQPAAQLCYYTNAGGPARPGPLYKLEIVSDLVEGKEKLHINCTIFYAGAREIRLPLPELLENCEDFTTFKFGFR